MFLIGFDRMTPVWRTRPRTYVYFRCFIELPRCGAQDRAQDPRTRLHSRAQDSRTRLAHKICAQDLSVSGPDAPQTPARPYQNKHWEVLGALGGPAVLWEVLWGALVLWEVLWGALRCSGVLRGALGGALCSGVFCSALGSLCGALGCSAMLWEVLYR